MDREQSILEAAAALPPLERCGFLEVVCAGQPQLRARIENLLRTHDTHLISGIADPANRDPAWPSMGCRSPSSRHNR